MALECHYLTVACGQKVESTQSIENKDFKPKGICTITVTKTKDNFKSRISLCICFSEVWYKRVVFYLCWSKVTTSVPGYPSWRCPCWNMGNGVFPPCIPEGTLRTFTCARQRQANRRCAFDVRALCICFLENPLPSWAVWGKPTRSHQSH